MNSIKQIQYHNMNCLSCGDSTRADLAFFDISEVIRNSIEDESPFVYLRKIDLRFYYTIRDLCQVYNYKCNYEDYAYLTLRVGHIRKHIEFILGVSLDFIVKTGMDDAYFDTMMRKFNVESNDVNDFILLLKNIHQSSSKDLVINMPIKFILKKDDLGREYPAGLSYIVGDREYTSYKRICPNCNKEYNKDAGRHSEYMIGIVGLKGSGKSQYIHSLINELDRCYTVKVYNKDIDDSSFIYLPISIYDKTHNFIFIDIPEELFEEKGKRNQLIRQYKMLSHLDLLWCCMNQETLKDSDELSKFTEAIEYLGVRKTPADIIITHGDQVGLDLSNEGIDEHLLGNETINYDKVLKNRELVREYTKISHNFEISMSDLFNRFNMSIVSSNEEQLSGIDIPFLWSLVNLEIVKGKKSVINKNIMGEKVKIVYIDERDLYIEEEL